MCTGSLAEGRRREGGGSHARAAHAREIGLSHLLVEAVMILLPRLASPRVT